MCARCGHPDDVNAAGDFCAYCSVRCGGTPADADDAGSEARHQRQGSGHARRPQPVDRSRTDWGAYAAAIARWEHLTGRPAPAPTDDRGRLNPELPEWMMGLPAGWVTGRVSRAQALRMVGNGVCPQQAVAAYGLLLGAADLRAADHGERLLPTPQAADGTGGRRARNLIDTDGATRLRPSGAKASISLQEAIDAATEVPA